MVAQNSLGRLLVCLRVHQSYSGNDKFICLVRLSKKQTEVLGVCSVKRVDERVVFYSCRKRRDSRPHRDPCSGAQLVRRRTLNLANEMAKGNP